MPSLRGPDRGRENISNTQQGNRGNHEKHELHENKMVARGTHGQHGKQKEFDPSLHVLLLAVPPYDPSVSSVYSVGNSA